MSGGTNSEVNNLDKLRDVMKQVAARLENGVSYNSSTEAFRPLVDQLAIVKDKNSHDLAVKASLRAEALFGILQTYWLNTIKYKEIAQAANPEINRFNSVVGSQVIDPLRTARGFAGIELVNETDQISRRMTMYNFTIGLLKEGSTNNASIKEYNKRRDKIVKDASNEAWKIHLDKNPGLRAWVIANPTPALKKRQEFNSQNTAKEIEPPSYLETQIYLSKFIPSIL